MHIYKFTPKMRLRFNTDWNKSQYFYDGQIRRYLIQIIRLFSNFTVKYSDGTLTRVPVVYGDADRQAANIVNQNSENTLSAAPKIAVYII